MRDERVAVSDDYSFCPHAIPCCLDATRINTSKISCLDHILKAVDIKPVTSRIEHADGILLFQQFLK
jgi:hypothetical protein